MSPTELCGRTVVVTEQATDSLVPVDVTVSMLLWRTIDQHVAQPLVVPFAMVMRHELGERPSKVAFTERDDAIEAFLPDRAHKPLAVGIQIRIPWWQDDGLDPTGA